MVAAVSVTLAGEADEDNGDGDDNPKYAIGNDQKSVQRFTKIVCWQPILRWSVDSQPSGSASQVQGFFRVKTGKRKITCFCFSFRQSFLCHAINDFHGYVI
ncbi:unnamed protein product [Ilex paraguariensis]|uniref:Uncharacterized protein n=1 Tax=Ilex paraguariensis TaxID=185542 RepID=A0ABC8RGK9_9AQUA